MHVRELDNVTKIDLQHTIFLLTIDHRLNVAPIEKQPHRVLDAGCGTGIWAIEYGTADLTLREMREIMLTSFSRRRTPRNTGNKTASPDTLTERSGSEADVFEGYRSGPEPDST